MGHGSKGYSDGDFHWHPDRTPEEEPLWVRMYGDELLNRPPEEWQLAILCAEGALRRGLAAGLLARAEMKLSAMSFTEPRPLPFQPEVFHYVPYARNDISITLEQWGDVITINDYVGSYNGINWLETPKHYGTWKRWGKKGDLISPGEWDLRHQAAQILKGVQKVADGKG